LNSLDSDRQDWNAEVDPDTGQVIASHAEVAETTHTAFSGTDRVTLD
jgi:hypothetical protein